jgi:hypothetical protein
LSREWWEFCYTNIVIGDFGLKKVNPLQYEKNKQEEL